MPRPADRQASAERFSHEAQRFIAWADGSQQTAALSAADALRRVLALYAAALQLPQPWSRGVSKQEAQPPLQSERLQRLRVRASSLPLQHYSEIFSPLVHSPDSPRVGDLADDLVDIYRDVATGLHLYESGRVDDAIWHWGFNFQTQWGEHASSAIRALHCYLAQEDPSGLSSDG
jgi:hypothetical protein